MNSGISGDESEGCVNSDCLMPDGGRINLSHNSHGHCTEIYTRACEQQQLWRRTPRNAYAWLVTDWHRKYVKMLAGFRCRLLVFLLLLLYSSCLVCKHPPHPRYIQNDRWRSESMLKITHCCSCLFGASGNMITVIILLIRGTYHSLECKYSARVIASHQQNTTYSICTELSCWYYYFQRMNMFFLFLIHHSSWLVTERSRGCSMRQVKRGVMVVNAEEMKKYT